MIDVLAAYVPAYTDAVARGERGPVPTPLVLGPGCVGRVVSVADDVFNVEPGDVVLDLALLNSGAETDPAEILIGWTGVGGRGATTGETAAMRKIWRDGTFAERALCPKETLMKLPGAESYPRPERLAFLGWLAVAGEGMKATGLQPGGTAAIIGATGQLGSAATLIALASGAGRVVAAGRDAEVLKRLGEWDSRVIPVAMTGSRSGDAAAIAEAAAGGVDVVLDALGAVPDAAPTMAGYDSLRSGGTMVLIGGVRQDLAVPYGDLMRRRRTLRGSWMSSPATALAMWRMVQSGVIDLAVIDVHTVGLDDPDGALELAAAMNGPAFVALVP
ncbi:zinc-binding dehydrogenase [Amycolatopsis minnesotensis]|uniref:Alcohol dehydrogenase n=1 Tax=Amycolatopsis minnesotensis TaxID=337894 RepID=A0ABP5BYT8_9PSEU